MDWKYGLWAWGSTMIAILTAIKTAFDFYSLIYSPKELISGNLKALFWWAIAFIVSAFFAIFSREIKLKQIRSKSRIKVADFGMDEKKFNSVVYYGVYVDFNNKPHENATDANSTNVYATIEWRDKSNKIVSTNPGRWFIPNDDIKKTGSVGLQTVDLPASGLPRRLHFSVIKPKTNYFFLFWRTVDNLTRINQLKDNFYTIKITLRDDSGSKCECEFEIRMVKGKKWYDAVASISYKKEHKKFPLHDLKKLNKANKKGNDK